MTEQKAIEDIQRLSGLCKFGGDCMSCDICYRAVPMAIEALEKQGSYEQILWERDIAIKQLEDIGLSFGEKTDRVKEALEKQAGIERALKRLEEKLSQKHKLMLREDRDEIRYFYEMQMLKEAIEILKEEVG